LKPVKQENQAYLKEQILTYLGNKRSLLGFIEQGVKYAKDELKKEKLSCCDLFSGSGVVARFLKQNSEFLVANDLELYSFITNSCYLQNATSELRDEINFWQKKLEKEIGKSLSEGFITRLYAPQDDENIAWGERVFYTKKNAKFIDTARRLIDEILPEEMRKFFIAPLLYNASVHAFGGRGQNAISRITSDINLTKPIFSNFSVPFEVYQKDANLLAKELSSLDLVYLDPPYNQHPYGSNYFMLNLIASYTEPSKISKVSGISKDWNRSVFNKKSSASEAFFGLIANLKAKFVLISFNSEGFINQDEFDKNLKKMGKVHLLRQKYNAYRGSRNLKARNIHVDELLYVLKK